MELQAHTRAIFGKKVKTLRRSGVTPANLFGRGMESQGLQVATAELYQALRKTGRNALVTLSVDAGEGRSKPSYDVMVRDVQQDPVTGQVLHVDFYRVELTESMEVDVPVILVGLPEAVELDRGTLVHGVNSIRVRGLPGTLPSELEIDVTGLKEAHQALHAGDIAVPPGVMLVSDPDQLVATIVPPRVAAEREEAEGAAAEAAAPEEAPEESRET